MPRHVDLRDNRDEPILRVLHEVGIFLLRVVTSRAAADLGAPAVLREVRPAGDLDPPALVVGEVQVEAVHLVERQQVDVALHIVGREEVARHVEHRPAPAEARPVHDLSREQKQRMWVGRRVLDFGREQVPERLDTVEEPGWRRSRYRRTLGSNGQPVPLGSYPRRVAAQREDDIARGCGSCNDVRYRLDRVADQIREKLPDPCGLALVSVNDDSRLLCEVKRVGRREFDGSRHRNDAVQHGRLRPLS